MKNYELALVLTFMFSVTKADAFSGYCTEPSPPYCIDGFNTFDDEWAFNSCKQEVESYLDSVNTFQSCLNDLLEQVRSEASNTVDKFNCRAEGNTFCP